MKKRNQHKFLSFTFQLNFDLKKNLISENLEQHMAFMVQFSTEHNVETGALKFDSIVFNDGDSYDPMTGMVTVPYDGVYTFSFQVKHNWRC